MGFQLAHGDRQQRWLKDLLRAAVDEDDAVEMEAARSALAATTPPIAPPSTCTVRP